MSAVAAIARGALWAAGLASSVLLLSSVFRQPLTFPQTVGLALFAALSIARPIDALLLFAALGPLIGVIGAMSGLSFGGARLLETLVLLLLIPWIARQARGIRSARWRALDWALVAFAVVVATSAAAHAPMIAIRTGTDSVSLALWRLLTRTYLEHAPGFEVIAEAALLLEGIGLCALVSRLADHHSVRRVTGMFIAGATGAALLNIYRLFEVALRRGPLTETLWPAFRSLRINTQFGDVNAAASYFVLAFVACVGLSGLATRRRRLYATASVILGIAVWLAGSRIGLAAVALAAMGAVVMAQRSRRWRDIPTRTRLVAAGALVMIVVAAFVLYPRGRNIPVGFSVWARAELIATAFRMLGDRPLLGVGVSRFYELFPDYASPALRQKFFEAAMTPVLRENAHNNFMQVLSELGSIGFAAFIAVLWLALRPDKLHVDPTDVRRPMAIGVGIFLVTAFFGHPLLTPEVAYPFWIALGLAAAGTPDLAGRRARMLRAASVGVVVLLTALMPIRARFERRHADLDGLALGMSGWHRDPSGNRFRWAGTRSAFFVESEARLVRIPLRAAGAGETTSCSVEIRIDGQPVDRLTIPGDFWQEARLRLPPPAGGRRHYRLDLIADERCGGDPPQAGQTLMVGRPDAVVAPSGPSLPR